MAEELMALFCIRIIFFTTPSGFIISFTSSSVNSQNAEPSISFSEGNRVNVKV